jgi:hypothetical protein
MLVDEEIWQAFPGDADHSIVEIFNPSIHILSITKLNTDIYLSLAQRTQVESFLSGIARRRRAGVSRV